MLADALGYGAEPGLVVLVRAKDGGVLDTTDPEIQAEVARLADELRGSEYVGHVTNPLEEPVPGLIAEDGRSLVLPARLTHRGPRGQGRPGRRIGPGAGDVRHRRRRVRRLRARLQRGQRPDPRDLTMAELIAFPLLGAAAPAGVPQRRSRPPSRSCSASCRSSAPSSRCG